MMDMIYTRNRFKGYESKIYEILEKYIKNDSVTTKKIVREIERELWIKR
jgi:hypothetical protein